MENNLSNCIQSALHDPFQLSSQETRSASTEPYFKESKDFVKAKQVVIDPYNFESLANNAISNDDVFELRTLFKAATDNFPEDVFILTTKLKNLFWPSVLKGGYNCIKWIYDTLSETNNRIDDETLNKAVIQTIALDRCQVHIKKYIISFFLQKKCDINYIWNAIWDNKILVLSSITYAIYSCEIPFIKWLFNQGASIDSRCIEIAFNTQNKEVAEEVIECLNTDQLKACMISVHKFNNHNLIELVHNRLSFIEEINEGLLIDGCKALIDQHLNNFDLVNVVKSAIPTYWWYKLKGVVLDTEYQIKLLALSQKVFDL